jgi:potassium efflux system protein
VQTGRLLRALTLALWIGGLFWVWSDVLPALGRLDETVLWHVASKAEDGSAISEAVSLRSVLLGILVLVLTTVAARNLPGLMELGVLSRTSINPASRYAITAMSRYAIVIAGSLIGLSLLGLRWSQLQWMAAALTVGLGFGLQEIFANFVSGLILLSERPFRFGDVITIADQTGTVTRISTRATTLLDFDGKELVVPNKTFITDRLINWTLSDTQTRVVVKVGVAYGTSPERVHSLLQQVAAEHPLVLAEPPPRSWFMAFGGSSLDFELRVFVATISDRLPVANDLHGRIANLFVEQGVEIAFPQMDLHLRSVPPPAKPVSDADDS